MGIKAGIGEGFAMLLGRRLIAREGDGKNLENWIILVVIFFRNFLILCSSSLYGVRTNDC